MLKVETLIRAVPEKILTVTIDGGEISKREKLIYCLRHPIHCRCCSEPMGRALIWWLRHRRLCGRCFERGCKGVRTALGQDGEGEVDSPPPWRP